MHSTVGMGVRVGCSLQDYNLLTQGDHVTFFLCNPHSTWVEA